MAITSGWGRGSWGASVWGDGAVVTPAGVSAAYALGTPIPAILAQPAGVSAAYTLGDETAIGAALAAPTGVSTTYALGTPSPAILAQPVGVSTTSYVMGARTWNEILEFQNDAYVEVGTPAPPTWTEVSEPAPPTWTDVPN